MNARYWPFSETREVADELARHFPRRPGETDRNELPDSVSRG